MSRSESGWQDKLWKDATPTLANSWPKIQNVPSTLKKKERKLEKYYVPKMFSFGPIHHGNFSFGENLKLKLARHFVRQNNIKEDELRSDIVNNLSNLKASYDQQSMSKSIKDDDLAWVFFIDGCAVLHFIYCDVGNKLDKLHVKKDQVAFARYDLFLLENQLPYGLLELVIYKVEEKKQEYQEAIVEFVKCNLLTENDMKGTSSLGRELNVAIQVEDSPCHLLHLLHRELIKKKDKKDTSSTLCAEIGNKLVCVGKREKRGGYGFLDWPSYRSVKELKDSGIWLRPSEEISLRDITFQSFFGVGILKLPKLVVDDFTTSKLFNLTAYEMHPYFPNDFMVTSYVCFLGSIIAKPMDVRELRKAKILLNAFGSDEDITNLFKEVSRNLIENPVIYFRVRMGIEEHCNGKVRFWIAQFLQDYFNTPWKGLAFFGVLFGFGLTLVQTYYAIHSAR